MKKNRLRYENGETQRGYIIASRDSDGRMMFMVELGFVMGWCDVTAHVWNLSPDHYVGKGKLKNAPFKDTFIINVNKSTSPVTILKKNQDNPRNRYVAIKETDKSRQDTFIKTNGKYKFTERNGRVFKENS